MTTYRSAVVHTTIDAPPESVAAFMNDLHNWTAWAPWIQSVTRRSPRDWILETADGEMRFHFVEPNTLGILDHEVTLPTGVTITNSLRVVANGTGSEIAMVLYQWPHMSPDDFDRDVQAVTGDFARIKDVVENGDASVRD